MNNLLQMGILAQPTAPADLHTWECLFREPTQDDIAVDGTPYYFPMNDAAPNTSIQNSLGTITLTKTGAGTATAITDFTFNASGKAVNYDGNVYHSIADLGTALGLQDIYFEWDGDLSLTGNRSIAQQGVAFSDANDGWVLFIGYPYMQFAMWSATVVKSCYWALSVPDHRTIHRFKLSVDRSGGANSKLTIDDIDQGAASGDYADFVATSIAATSFKLGTGIANTLGKLSQVKYVRGSYTGSTTPAFKTGLTPSKGTSVPSFTNATLQTGILKKRNPNGIYLATSLAGNPQYQNLDSSVANKCGLLMEHPQQNCCLHSREFDNAAWTATNITVSGGEVGIDGIKKAYKLISTAPNGTIESMSAIVSGGRWLPNSFYLRADSGTFTSSDVVIETEGSAAPLNTASDLLDAETGLTAVVGTTWKRCYVYKDMNGHGGSIKTRIKMITSGLTIYVDAGQLELSASSGGDIMCTKMPSAYIYTGATPVTRDISQLTLNPAEIQSTKWTWLAMFNPHYASSQVLNIGTQAGLLNVNSDLGQIRWYYRDDGKLQIFIYGTTFQQTTVKTWNYGDWVCVGGIVDSDSDAYSLIYDGLIDVTDSGVYGAPTYTNFKLGTNNTDSLGANGAFGVIRLYKGRALTQLQITDEETKMKALMGI